MDKLREILDDFPGILFEANTFLTERVDETISGYTSPVVVNIYGNDLNQLDAKAQAVAEIMRDIDGATDVQLRSPPGTPLLQIVLNLDQLSFWGVLPAQIVDTLQAAYETRVVGKNIQGNKIYNVAVTLTPELRQQPESIAKLPIRTQDGTMITLEQVAEIRHSASRYNILHQGSQRRQTVTGNVIDRDLDDFMAELKERVLKEIPFSADIYPEFTGAAIEQAQARKELILHSLLAGAGVLIFIYIAIGSIRHVLLTLANLPFALIGGVAAVVLTGATLVGRFGRGFCDAVRHYRAQQHHAAVALSLSGRSRRQKLESGHRRTGRAGTLAVDPDDGAGHRVGDVPDCVQQR